MLDKQKTHPKMGFL